jgi:uncharacterized protein YqeY
MLRAAIQSGEKSKRTALSDDELQATIAREVKVRRESIAEFRKAGRDDLLPEQENAVAILSDYLPQQLSDEELESLVAAAVKAMPSDGADNPRAALGRVMKEVMGQTRGRADGDRVRLAVERSLANQGSR